MATIELGAEDFALPLAENDIDSGPPSRTWARSLNSDANQEN